MSFVPIGPCPAAVAPALTVSRLSAMRTMQTLPVIHVRYLAKLVQRGPLALWKTRRLVMGARVPLPVNRAALVTEWLSTRPSATINL